MAEEGDEEPAGQAYRFEMAGGPNGGNRSRSRMS